MARTLTFRCKDFTIPAIGINSKSIFLELAVWPTLFCALLRDMCNNTTKILPWEYGFFTINEVSSLQGTGKGLGAL